MGTRDYRDGLANRVDAVCPARGVDGRKAAPEAVDAAGVEVKTYSSSVARSRESIAAATTSRGADRPSGALPPSPNHLGCQQNRAFTPNGFGDQRSTAATTAVKQHRRVELNELDVAHRDTGPQRQRDPIAGGARGIGGRAVKMRFKFSFSNSPSISTPESL